MMKSKLGEAGVRWREKGKEREWLLLLTEPSPVCAYVAAGATLAE